MVLLFDRVSLDGVASRETRDGYIAFDAVPISRSGVYLYSGKEVGKPEMPVVRVYRSPEEVFAVDAMRSAAHRPLTNNHPPTMITADNWKQYSVGQSGGEVVRDGELLRVPMVIMDSKTIRDYKGGKKELSPGYESEIIFDSGISPEGEAYDAVQKAISLNHIAIVTNARGGSQLNLGDDQPTKEKPVMAERTVIVDGLSVITTDQGAQAIEKLMGERDVARRQLEDAQTSHTALMSAKDKELGTQAAEIATLKGAKLTDAQIDALVRERSDVLTKAVRVVGNDAKLDGLSLSDIRKAVVSKKMGDSAIKDRSDDYIQAMFDGIVGAIDPIRDNLANRSSTRSNTIEAKDGVAGEHQAWVSAADDHNAWRTKAA